MDEIKKALAIIVMFSLLFSSCSPLFSNTESLSESESNFSELDESTQAPSNLENVARESFVEGLARSRAEELGLFDMNEEEAIKAAYKYLVEEIYFRDPVGLDLWRYMSEETEPIPFIENRSLSPLLFEIGSCEDFAAEMVMLLRACGLEAMYVSGFTLSVEQEYIDHAWAVVNLNGNWYHLDPQLEHNIVKSGQIRYRYFMKTDSDMEFDHKWGENLIEYWSGMPQSEKDNILAGYLVPKCETIYPQQEPEPVVLPPTPDMNMIQQRIEEIKENSGKENPLPPIILNVDPPILVREYHITPLLLPQYYSKAVVDKSGDLPRYGAGFLSVPKLEFYNQLKDYLQNPTDGEKIKVLSKLSNTEIQEVIQTFFDDYPEYYWAKFKPSGGDSYALITFAFKDGINLREVGLRNLQLENYAKSLLSLSSEMSDFEKVLLIHDTLGSRIKYDAGYVIHDSDNAFGGIINKFGYCDGYARSFQYLANFAGIENIYIRGRDLKGTTHAWNAVKLNGNWYYLDVTWDRASNWYDGAYHDFFCISLDKALQGRVWDESQYPYLPESESDEYDYYIKKDYVVFLNGNTNAYNDTERLADIFKRQLDSKDNLLFEYRHTILELKILGNHSDYMKWKDSYNKNAFNILKETEEKARSEKSAFSISYDTEVSCYFNDSMQTLSFYAKVKAKNQ